MINIFYFCRVVKYLFMRSKFLFLGIGVFFFSFFSYGQEVTHGREAAKADVNFTELANQQHPAPLMRKPVFDESEEGEEENRNKLPNPDPSQVHMIHRNVDRTTSPSTLPQSPWPLDTFLSTVSNSTTIPPDTHGDIDTTYCVTTVNDSIVIRKRSGAWVTGNSLDGFWNSMLGHGNGSFDPRVYYDPNYKRWIMVCDAYGQMTFSQIMVGVSATSDPTGTWHLYEIPTNDSGKSWLDFPNVGFNNRWITVSGNFYQNVTGSGVKGGVLYVFDYASIMAGTGAPYTTISKSTSFSLCPALTYDATESNMFVVDVYKNNTGQLQLWKISGTTAAPTMASVGYPTTTQHWNNGGSGDFVQQEGTSNLVQAGDDRITRLVYRNNKLWCAHTVFLPYPGTATRCSAMWWQMDTLANALQNGLVDDATTPSFFAYTSIAVNANDDAMVGFSYCNSNMHPSAGYALHMHTDPADSIRPAHVFRHGKATYYEDFGGTQNRWGDYSAACTDPKNNNDFWVTGESVHALNIWDTWWAYIPLCPSYSIFNVEKHLIENNTLDTFTFTGSAPAGTTYSWNFGTGATPATSSSPGPIEVKWSSYGTKAIKLTVTSPTGCTSTLIDSVLVRNIVGLNSVQESNERVTIVPNPNNGLFDLVFSSPVAGSVSVKLLNLEGKLVYDNRFTVGGSNSISIETKNLPAGTYIANIDIDGTLVSEKVTISK